MARTATSKLHCVGEDEELKQSIYNCVATANWLSRDFRVTPTQHTQVARSHASHRRSNSSRVAVVTTLQIVPQFFFTTRRYAQARSLLSPGVRLSVTLVDCIHTADDIVKLLSQPVSPIILVFWPPAPVPNSKGNLFSGDTKFAAVGKFCDFRLKSPSISETVKDRPLVAMER